MGPDPQETGDLVTITEELLNGKLHSLCSVALLEGLMNLNSVEKTFPCLLFFLICVTQFFGNDILGRYALFYGDS